ncbi:hypothetical protein BH18ACT15_BH18ACT15_15870 [soil metagenome]
MLEQWTEELSAALGVEEEIDVGLILDLAKIAAHRVERPAAPLPTHLVGLAAARDGCRAEAVARAAATVRSLSRDWGARQA